MFHSSALRLIGVLFTLTLVATACGDDTVTTGAAPAEDAQEPTCFSDPGLDEVDTDATSDGDVTLTLATHDSFFLSEGTLAAFTAETGIEVEQVAGGDAGTLVSQAILTQSNPTADVLFGIDNAFLCRGLEAGLFLPYASPALADVDDALELDPHNRVTPIDYGDVCVNYWTSELPGDVPTSLDDLIDPVNMGEFVTENPETSSPGFAFLLATIATYGEDGWEDYWTSLVENDIAVQAGWNEAYYGDYTAGGGDRSIVTSYASSPPAEFLFADPPVDAAPSGSLSEGCFRQIEFAGILDGTDHPAEAAMLIDFMLSTTYQEDVPLNMFVYPANGTAALPAEFVEYGPLVDAPLTLDPELIEANRDDWTSRWNEIVLG
jgi:thiamine transport system substrate-binding protein